MEKIKIKKVGKSKWGEFAVVDDGSEKGIFVSITPQVKTFLSQQLPCEVEVQEKEEVGNRKDVITRVKVLGSSPEKVESAKENSFEQPIQVEKPFEQIDRQKSIESQMCIKSAIDLIKINNDCEEFENIKPTKNSLYETALIIREVLEDLKKS